MKKDEDRLNGCQLEGPAVTTFCQNTNTLNIMIYTFTQLRCVSESVFDFLQFPLQLLEREG